MKYKYDVAISYASEQRRQALKLCEELQKLDLKIFADFIEPERLWGSYLPEELRKIYYNESKIIIIFLSKEYVKKGYTLFESHIAMEKSLENISFLIIKFDDVELPWLNTTIGYINWNEYSVLELAEMIQRKTVKKK